MDDTISRAEAIEWLKEACEAGDVDKYSSCQRRAIFDEAIQCIEELPSAQPDLAENLYQYKCCITDKEGLQHEVIHTGDIRRVTGWMI